MDFDAGAPCSKRQRIQALLEIKGISKECLRKVLSALEKITNKKTKKSKK